MLDRDIVKKYNLPNFSGFLKFMQENKLSYTNSFLNVSVDDELVDEYMQAYLKNVEYKARIAEQERIRYEQEQAVIRAEEARLQAIAADEAARQRALEEEEALNKQQAMATMLISSGFSFEGYKIVKYSGYISGDDAVQIPRSGVFGGNNGKNLTEALVRIRRQALIELKEAAYDLGCNAVVGVDFDYITLEPETANFNGGTLYEPYIICVTANGNAVVIEPTEE